MSLSMPDDFFGEKADPQQVAELVNLCRRQFRGREILDVWAVTEGRDRGSMWLTWRYFGDVTIYSQVLLLDGSDLALA